MGIIGRIGKTIAILSVDFPDKFIISCDCGGIVIRITLFPESPLLMSTVKKIRHFIRNGKNRINVVIEGHTRLADAIMQSERLLLVIGLFSLQYDPDDHGRIEDRILVPMVRKLELKMRKNG